MPFNNLKQDPTLPNKFKLELFLVGLGLGVIATIIVLSSSFIFAYRHKFYPGIHIDKQLVAGLSQEEAKNLLSNKTENLNDFQITLTAGEISVASSSGQLELKRDYDTAIKSAFDFSRNRNFLYRLYSIWQSQKQKPNFNSQLKIDEEKAKQMATELAQKVNSDYNFPLAKLNYSGSIGSLEINPGKLGQELLIDETTKIIADKIDSQNVTIAAEIATRGVELNQAELSQARDRASRYVNLFLELKADDFIQQISDQDLINLLDFPQGVKTDKLAELVNNLAQKINRSPTNAIFNFDENTLRVSEFVAPRDGLELDIDKTKEQISELIAEIDDKNCEETHCDASQQFYKEDLQVKKTAPEVTLEKTNNLGIKQLIGFGDSHYAHSIPNRIYNVAHASEKINNVIVAPNQEFSLVKTLGPVNKNTGFKSAYVIDKGATVLGDGGGVCQVSTTVFRAALDAGLNITRRLPHSYRVSYYELNSKPGVDATVFTGDVDLRFINDTPNYILIHNEVDSEKLYMKVEIYGTSDGRTAEIVDHKTWGYTTPPTTQYIPTPDLPTGVTKRIENAIPGIKAEFTNLIKDKDGNIISEKKYFSNYQAWGAKYLVGM